jgi:transposase-like protein
MDFALSTQKLAVIDALSSGATVIDAAEHAGVHRNTISNWRRNSPDFQEAFAHAQYDRALYFREKAEALADLAIQTIQAILIDPKTPPSVRLKAALAIIAIASTPPEPRREVAVDFEKIVLKQTAPQTVSEDQLGPAPLVHNHAQPVPQASVAESPSPTPQSVHNSAQAPRPSHKIGRNEACPCGSGQKYKRCCLNKPHLAKAA